MNKKAKIGDVRPSQLLFTYGVGSIIDLPKMSVIVTGLEDWPANPNYVHEIKENRLLTAVRYRHPTVMKLLSPPVVPENNTPTNPFDDTPRIGVPVATFPRWMVCPQCRLLAHVSSGLFQLKVNPTYPDRTVYKHVNCSKSKTPPEVIPARFLVVCPEGHMDDFPWLEFVHASQDCSGQPLLRLQEFGPSGEARYLEVRCETCGQKRRLSDAFGKDNLRNMPRCTGRRPHLRDYDVKECEHQARPIILGASNMWFPVVLSAVAIPVDSGRLEKLIDEKWLALKDVSHISVIEFLRSQGQLGQALSEYEDQDIWNAVTQRIKKEAQNQEPPLEMPDLKAPEWQVFTTCDEALNTEDFHLRSVELDTQWQFNDAIDQVVVVERLREARALIGFTRLDAAGELTDPELGIEIEPAPISRQPPTWVPTDEVRGEGIFIRFNEKEIQKWEQKPSVEDFAEKFYQAHWAWRRARRISPPEDGFPGIRYVLLHSFSHILMRELALEAGYSIASLRERIYSRSPLDDSGPMSGILIYTAAADSEGTLGGLASLGSSQILQRHILQALENAYLCASDPLCAENMPGQDGRAIHAAACHNCLFAPETSCERGNKYLDRAVLVRTIEKKTLSFFDRVERDGK